jgi:hypothetical protein
VIQVLCSILVVEGEESKCLDNSVILHFSTLNISLQQGAGNTGVVAVYRLVRMVNKTLTNGRKYCSKLLGQPL